MQGSQPGGGGGGGSSYVLPSALAAGSVPTYALAATASSGTMRLTPVFRAPALTSFSPTSGPVNSTITLNGTDLAGTTTVTFAGTANNTVTSGFTINVAGTQITGVVVPTGAVTGPIAVTAPSGTGTSASSFTVTAPAPTITSFSPAGGVVNRAVTITGTDFTSGSTVTFNGTNATVVTVNSATQITASVPAGATTGPIRVTTAAGTAVSATNFTVVPNPVIYSFSPSSGPAGSTVVITGDNFSSAYNTTLAVTFNQANMTASFVVNSATQITATVPGNATSGPIGVNTGGSTAFSPTAFAVTAAASDLTVSSAQNVSGSYNNVTITASGVATLTGALTVSGTLTVQTDGQLLTACQTISGPGSFVLQPGATLSICDANGISASGATGAVQLSGSRSFSDDALYVYQSTTGAQVSGSGLPTTVRELTLDNTDGLTLTNDLALRQVLRFANGNLDLSGHTLTLRSSAAGTALVAVPGNGRVLDGTGTCRMERYIDPSLNPGLGYRHFSSPIAGMTVGALATSGFTPELNQAYNTAATPSAVSPFPTVFAYNEARLATANNNLAPFDKGWVVPTAATPMAGVTGYTANVPATSLVTFSGTGFQSNTGRFLPARGASAEAGWALVGNPFPSPFDLSMPNSQNRIYVDDASYVYESTGQYTGQYRAYVNGIGNPLLAAGQGFFVRQNTPTQNAVFILTGSGRVTSFGTQQPFRRAAADVRPQVHVVLRQGTAPADEVVVYAEAGATTGADAAYDAHKLPNPGNASVYAVAAGAAEPLAIQGLPALTAGTVVPLGVALASTGTATLTASFGHLPAGLTAYLADAVTGSRQDLSLDPTYRFTAPAGALQGRFALVFGASAPLSTATAQAATMALYPNPAQTLATLAVAPAAQARPVLVLDAVGRVVRQLVLAGQVATMPISLTGLPAGVYAVRCGTATTRLVIE